MSLFRLSTLSLAALLWFGGSQAIPAAELESLWLGDGDRLLVLAPHPDDETLSAGGLIQEALDLDLPVRVCFFTMGDNDETAALFTRRHPMEMPGAVRAMGTLRQNEAIAAAIQLGLSTNDLVFLGYPDSGTLDIWNAHWREAPPLRSMLTKVTAVPFELAISTGAPYSGESIVDDLTDVIRDFRPTHIVVSLDADHNADHRALALFTRIALWNLAAQDIAPELLSAPIHFTQWPKPRRIRPDRPARPPYFLDDQVEWMKYGLANYQVSNKVAALRRHHSQLRDSPACLQSSIRNTELFGIWPDLSFPGGDGLAELPEEDTTQFRSDNDSLSPRRPLSSRCQALQEQQAAETRSIRNEDNDFLLQTLSGDGINLTLSFQFLHPVLPSTTLTVSLFSYLSDRPFGPLPKWAVRIRDGRILSVTDLDTPLPKDTVEVLSGAPDTVTLRVPFAQLGHPEKLFVGARLSKGTLPIDWIPWRILDCSGKPFPEAPPSGAAPTASAPLPAEAKKAQQLTPRVRLPRRVLPDRTEANEPVLW